MDTVNSTKTSAPAGKAKTWQRTDSWPKGLMRHKTGNYYLRTFTKGKETFIPLKTDVLEGAKARAVAERKDIETIRRSCQAADQGLAPHPAMPHPTSLRIHRAPTLIARRGHRTSTKS